tara:strand:+ start:1774 stop:2559 length:786 start_codon:yes stop_codon:yes gene_type:complete
MKKFFVIGNKVSNSLSPTIFNYWFKKYNVDAYYDHFELNDKNFELEIKKLLTLSDLNGLNITIPFKQKIIKHISKLDQHAKKINAVNCVSIGRKTKGFNTDWEGYYKTLPRIKNIKSKKIIIIGYGGAALAIHYLLKTKGCKKILFFNRTKKKLRFTKDTMFTKSIKSLNKYLNSADIIINTSPKNLINSNNMMLVKKTTILSDIVYKPKETVFLKAFKNNKKIYGISMLLEQAALSFKIWFGFTPSIDKNLLKILDKKIR